MTHPSGQGDEDRAREIYDAALIAEHSATGSTTPGYARRAAIRAILSFARETPSTDEGLREALETGEIVLQGRGNGTYAEAEDAIRVLIAALKESGK